MLNFPVIGGSPRRHDAMSPAHRGARPTPATTFTIDFSCDFRRPRLSIPAEPTATVRLVPGDRTTRRRSVRRQSGRTAPGNRHGHGTDMYGSTSDTQAWNFIKVTPTSGCIQQSHTKAGFSVVLTSRAKNNADVTISFEQFQPAEGSL